MDNILGTKFEQSLRLLLLLKINTMTEDRLSGIDFISTYTSDFGFDAPNLHGTAMYRLCEYPTRKLTCNRALKDLVLRGLVHPIISNGRFLYQITDNGISFINSCECAYSQKYKIISKAVHEYYAPVTDDELVSLIFGKAEASIAEGGHNE